MLVHANWPPAGVYRQGGPERAYDRPGVRERERERERGKERKRKRERERELVRRVDGAHACKAARRESTRKRPGARVWCERAHNRPGG